MSIVNHIYSVFVISLLIFSVPVVGEGDGFNWGDSGDGFNWGDDGDGFNWGDSGDGFDWGDSGGDGGFSGNDPPPGSGGDSGNGNNPDPFSGNNPIPPNDPGNPSPVGPQQNQTASWKSLSAQSIPKNSRDGTVVYTNVVGQCDDPDDPEVVGVVSAHSNYGLFIDGTHLKIRNLKQNHVGLETVTLDCNGVQASFSLTISATPNNPPVFDSAANKTVSENELIEFKVNATDSDNDLLTYSASNLPSGASFDTMTRTFSWRPGFTQAGKYDVTFTADDSFGGVGKLTVSIIVLNTNRAPDLNPIGSKNVTENSLLSFSVSGSDADGDTISFSASNLPSGASFSGQTFSWTPSFTQAGGYQVTFTVTDSNGASDSETVGISVSNTNRAPTITSLPVIGVSVDDDYEYDVEASDPDGDKLTFSLQQAPQGMTVNSLNGEIEWSPQDNQLGNHIVTVAVSDGSLTATQSFTVLVFRPNENPILSVIGDKTVSEQQLLEFTLTATDPDLDEVEFFAFSLPEGAQLDEETGTFRWTPNMTQAGAYHVTFGADDGHGGIDLETVKITVIDLVIGKIPKEREPSIGVAFSKVRLPSGEVLAPGEQLVFDVQVENDEDIDLEDLSISASVQEWGVRRSVGPFDLDEGEQVSRRIIIEIPEDAEAGEFDVRLTASNDELRHVTYRTITII